MRKLHRGWHERNSRIQILPWVSAGLWAMGQQPTGHAWFCQEVQLLKGTVNLLCELVI